MRKRRLFVVIPDLPAWRSRERPGRRPGDAQCQGLRTRDVIGLRVLLPREVLKELKRWA
jgi:hypothetical protein